jgi:hypothetical protein
MKYGGSTIGKKEGGSAKKPPTNGTVKGGEIKKNQLVRFWSVNRMVKENRLTESILPKSTIEINVAP